MENEIVSPDTSNGETTAEAETTDDVAALKAKAAKADELEATNRQLFERAKKAEGFVKVDGKWVKAPKPEEAIATQAKLDATTGELDETAMLLLEVKGIKTDDADEMKLVEEWRDAGKSVKSILSNKIFQAELKSLRDEKAVSAATPSSVKRGGNQSNDLASALAKYENNGTLPDDFELRSKVVNALVDKANTNKPSWK